MLKAIDEITSRGASYRSLAEPWADTTHELGEVLAALVGYIARKTREDILHRTSAGRKRARLNGVRFGRRPKLSLKEQQDAIAHRAAGEPQRQIANAFRVSPSTISRLRADRIELFSSQLSCSSGYATGTAGPQPRSGTAPPAVRFPPSSVV